MTPNDIKMVRNLSLYETSSLRITVATETGAAGEQINRFCNDLKQLMPDIKVKQDADVPFAKPVMVVGRNSNIAYHAVPSGKTLALFLDALVENADGDEKLGGEDIEKHLAQIDLPIAMKIYIADQCPHCPQVIRTLQSLAKRSPWIRLRIIKSDLFPHWCHADQIRSVPTLILDDEFRWTGPVQLKELLAICLKRDPSQLSAASLRQIIEDGQAQRVAAMMAQSHQVFSSLIDLLIHDRWSVRLGAMVVAEYLAEEAPSLALELSDLLWHRFNDLSEQAQGDVLHVIGQVKSAFTQGCLEAVMSGTFAEAVKQSAAEILDDFNRT